MLTQWIIAGAAIVTIVTVAVIVAAVLLAQPAQQTQPQFHRSWSVELWDIAHGYPVNFVLCNHTAVGREDLFPPMVGRLIQPDGTVSRQHCMLYEQDGTLWIWNLSAVNPAAVNGHRLNSPQPLMPGDRLELGNSTFLVTRVDCT